MLAVTCIPSDMLCLVQLDLAVNPRQCLMPVQLDLAVVEVGLGGTRDATNVIDADTLRVAVITSIGTDHKAALGEALQ